MRTLRPMTRRAAGVATLMLGLVALVLALPAGEAQAQTCTRGTCVATLQSVSPVVDGCGDHARPGRMKFTLASSRSVTFNEGKTGTYATLFPPRTVNHVPVDPKEETRTRGNFPTTVFAEIGTEHRTAGNFTDWEWRNENTNRGVWQRVPPTRWGISAPGIGESIYEVRPVAGAHIWSNAGEMVVVTLELTSVANATTSGRAYFMFMGGKGCARVNHAGQTDGTIQ